MKLDFKKRIKNLDVINMLNPNRYFNQHFSLKKTISISVIVASFICSIICINMASPNGASKASIVKHSTVATSDNALNKIVYEGQEMYVAKSSFYDYYSDSQVGSSSTPNAITDALSGGNRFSKFNKKLMALKKYNDPNVCPAKYPLFQGAPGAHSDMDGICYPQTEEVYKASNYWAAANWGQIGGHATQGLVDAKLSYDSYGNSILTQSNPANNKSTALPFFDKKFLTENKFDNSELSLGKVYENVAFPFRRVDKDGTIYYEFYSSKDTVRMNSNGQLDYLGYNKTENQVRDAEGNYGFFPYNTPDEGKSKSLNFGHGVKIEVPFNMTKNGKINNKDMVFEFSGDDDVWVFIDGILALDIGGNHGEISGSINFAKSESVVNKVKNNTVAFAKRTLSNFYAGNNTFSDLGIVNEVGVFTNHKTAFSSELKNKLKDTSKTHTLTLYYMERGLNVANMKMSFNLPEPTVLNVTNTIKTDNVGATFTEETKKVASKDSFMYDVSDRTMNRTQEIDLMNNEAVTYSNEFDYKDAILVQQKALKISTRSLTTLYSTSWNLTDIANEISKGTNLMVTDNRSTVEKTFLFANKDNDKVPVLTANYTNIPNIGKFKLECNVTSKYKDKHDDYKDTSFTYTIKYSNVFGGDSDKTAYKGKYTLYTTNDEKEVLETSDGTISLKPGQKIEIEAIPVTTKLYVSIALDDNALVNKIEATTNFKSDIKNGICSGNTIADTNALIYTIGDKDETVEDKTVTIPSNKKPSQKDPVKDLENVAEQDSLDESPATSDEAIVDVWSILGIISLIICISTFVYLYKTERHNVFYKE